MKRLFCCSLLIFNLSFTLCLHAVFVQRLTFVELNCENLFDCLHDAGKQDTEYLPDAGRHWSSARYWRKVNHVGQTLLACSADSAYTAIPDLIALCEVENDSTLRDLTRRSLLRNAGYEYLMTESPDERGIDVALLYSPLTFAPICYETIGVPLVKGMRPTRDILYVQGRLATGDTLHVFVVHAPSRFGGERTTRPYRLQVAKRLTEFVETLRAEHPNPKIIMAGDFNDGPDRPAMQLLADSGLRNVTAEATGSHGARGTYYYEGAWEHIDHVLISGALADHLRSSRINDAPFLLEPDDRYGGLRPRRTYHGYKYQPGFSDHLPLVVTFQFPF